MNIDELIKKSKPDDIRKRKHGVTVYLNNDVAQSFKGYCDMIGIKQQRLLEVFIIELLNEKVNTKYEITER